MPPSANACSLSSRAASETDPISARISLPVTETVQPIRVSNCSGNGVAASTSTASSRTRTISSRPCRVRRTS